MTQLEDDDLLNNLLKIPGTIIIYNSDMSSYDYVLNAHNVTLPLTPATSTAGSAASEQSVDDLNSSASIDTDLAGSPEPTYGAGGTVVGCLLPHQLLHPDSPASLMLEPAGTGGELSDQSFGSVAAGSGHGPIDGALLEDDLIADEGEMEEEEEEEELQDLEEMEVEPVEAGAGDEDDSEPELTNLSWLTELKNITNLTPSDVPLTDLPTARFNKFIAQVRRSRETYDKRKEQYTSVASSLEKPPFNYAQIIAMAMLDEGRMTLKQICKWIQEKFSYYKVHKNWNNSIRHNLSLSFFFTKVQRAKDEKGKGGYWELSMDVSKSERRRIRVRQRNKTATSAAGSMHPGSGRRTTAPPPRLPKGSTGSIAGSGGRAGINNNHNNNNNEQTVNNNLPKYHNHRPDSSASVVVPTEVGEEEIVLASACHSALVSCSSSVGELSQPATILDSNNNISCSSGLPMVDSAVHNAQRMQVQSVTIDIIDNYGKPPMQPPLVMDGVLQGADAGPPAGMDLGHEMCAHTSPTTMMPSIVGDQHGVHEDQQLIHQQASAMAENCAINFDSIINGDTGASIFNNLNVDEIFSDNEIPQPANDDIIVPFFSNVQQVQTGPNVVVETIPYYLPDMGTFDETDFGNLININEQEISDEFLNEHGFL